VTEDDALQHLRAILARPEYHARDSVPFWQQFLQPVLDWLWSVITQLYRLVVDSTTGREGAVGLVAVVVSAAILAAAVVYLVRAIRLSVVREAALRSASLAQRRERSDQLWHTAQQLAAAGRLPQAVRLVYLSALYALDERSILHVELALTNAEHARQLAQRYPALGSTFTDLVEVYEQVRYGRAPALEQTFQDLAGRAESLRSAAFQQQAAPA
jgi:hypothetical protein